MSSEVTATSEQVERLEHLNEISEQTSVDKTECQRKALEDLEGYGFTDLERFIQAASSERKRLTEKHGELLKHPGSSATVFAESERNDAEVLLEWKTSDDYLDFQKQFCELNRRLKVLRIRKNVAKKIRRRRLYGEDLPELDDIADGVRWEAEMPEDTYERRVWALLNTEKKTSVVEWIEDAQGLLNELGIHTSPAPDSIQRGIRGKLKEFYSFDRMDTDTLEELVNREADRLGLMKVE
jgi:hypothetical protein